MSQLVIKNLNTVLAYKEKIFIALVVGSIACAAMYAFFLQKAIFNVVDREKITTEIRTTSSAVSDLESKYFSLTKTINIELAHAKGFKDGEVTSFISKKPVTAMANSHEL